MRYSDTNYEVGLHFSMDLMTIAEGINTGINTDDCLNDYFFDIDNFLVFAAAKNMQEHNK